ncbi:hypothetical protein ACHAXN_009031, partial [Cyclotella atomus]
MENERLGRENNDLKQLLNVADVEKASLEAVLKQLEERFSLMCNDIDEKNHTVSKLTADLDRANLTRLEIDEQLANAKEEVAYLTQYK